jgi:hypothetical protein
MDSWSTGLYFKWIQILFRCWKEHKTYRDEV